MNLLSSVILLVLVVAAKTDDSDEHSHESSETSYVIVPPPLQSDPGRGKRQQEQLYLYPRLLTERLYGPDISSLQTPIIDNNIDGTVRFLGPANRRIGVGPTVTNRLGLRTTRRLYGSQNGYDLRRSSLDDIMRRRDLRRILRNRTLRRNILRERRLNLGRNRINALDDLLYDDLYDDYDYYDLGYDFDSEEDFTPRTALTGPLRPNLRGFGHRLSSNNYPVNANILKGGVFTSSNSFPKSRHPYLQYSTDRKHFIGYQPATKPFPTYRSTSKAQQRNAKN